MKLDKKFLKTCIEYFYKLVLSNFKKVVLNTSKTYVSPLIEISVIFKVGIIKKNFL